MINLLTKKHATLAPLALAISAVLLAGCNSGSSSSGTETLPTAREITQGSLEGVETGYGLAFMGIPYAKPPVGDLRFAPPEPADAWEGTLEASEFGQDCPQSGSAFNGFVDSLNEDCLYLNVYTPSEGENHPVMVWIHGGAFVTGSGGAAYEPQRLVEQGVVVVTLNYRLGALGFVPVAGLPEGNGHFGLMDQQLALQWVQDNIGQFGGDAGNVTIFGESAGGHSVLSQMVSAGANTGSEGLFHKAIVQSGAYQPAQLSRFVGEMFYGAPFLAATGCEAGDGVADCLRGKTVEEILAAQGSTWYNPTWGEGMLPHSIQHALTSNLMPQSVPVMTGHNLNEGRLFVALDEIPSILAGSPDPLDSYEDYVAAVGGLLAADPRGLDIVQIANDYLAQQEEGDPARFSLASAAIQTAWLFACDQFDQMDNLAGQNITTYGYWFTDTDAPSLFPLELMPALSFDLGAAHALEIQYVLNTEETMRERGASDEQIALSERMIDYWVQFARYGNPSAADGTANWSTYNSSEQLMELNPATLGTAALVDAEDAYEAHQCGYWANPPVNPT